MKPLAYHVLRLGLAVTFIWVGVLIFMEPTAWGGLMQPWAAGLLPVPVELAMRGTAVLDVLIGAALLVNLFTWAAAGLGALHLVVVLLTTGITDVTVRDIGLLTSSVALALWVWPENFFGRKK
jgi:uncharacterized membrane protein YphA (DoxX/SURF4 family)